MRVDANWPQNIGQMAYLPCSGGVFPARPRRRYRRGSSGNSRSPLDGLGAQFDAVIDVELAEDVREMALDGRPRDEHPLADLGVREPFGDELDHLRDEGRPAWELHRPSRGPQRLSE